MKESGKEEGTIDLQKNGKEMASSIVQKWDKKEKTTEVCWKIDDERKPKFSRFGRVVQQKERMRLWLSKITIYMKKTRKYFFIIKYIRHTYLPTLELMTSLWYIRSMTSAHTFTWKILKLSEKIVRMAIRLVLPQRASPFRNYNHKDSSTEIKKCVSVGVITVL